MKNKRVLCIIVLAISLAFAWSPARCRAACNTWTMDDPSAYTSTHVVISGGGASSEKSQEIGDVWEDVSLPPGAQEISDLKQFSDGSLYAATKVGVYGRVYKSTDGGLTWADTATLEIPGVRRASNIKFINEGSGSSIYAATYDTSLTGDNAGVWRSTDWGASWDVMTGLAGSGCTGVVEAADGSLVATTKGDGRVWRCPDPAGAPGVWNEVWDTSQAQITSGLPKTNYPSYPPAYRNACNYMWYYYGQTNCNGPYGDLYTWDYPLVYRTDRSQAPFRAGDGTLYFSTNTGTDSIYTGGVAVRGFGHVYVSTDNGATWVDGGSFNPPPTSSPEYRYQDPPLFPGSVPHENPGGTPPADNPPTDPTYPTWIDNFFEDSNGDIYACSSNGDPLRSWILNPRRDGVVYRLQKGAAPGDNQWNALGNLYGAGDAMSDTYTSTNSVYCHDMSEDAASGDLYAVSSVQAMVHRSTDGGATWDWHTSPRAAFGLPAAGDFFTMEITCDSCLYVGYDSGGEIYASRSAYFADGVIRNNTGWAYTDTLSGFSETTGSDHFGTITYQISDDGATFYWWDGGSWTATADPAESNAASMVNANIGSFSSPGTFYFRAYLHPTTVDGCPKSPQLVSVTVCAGMATPLVSLKLCYGYDENYYGYELPEPGDWTYWDAAARNPSETARDFWIIPFTNTTITITEVDAGDGGEQELAVLKDESGSDQNLYLYNFLFPGDYTFWDALARNPSPLARDLWSIPFGDDAANIADGGSNLASMKNRSGDYNLYLYESPAPGDYTYWDAAARNPSPLARDLWIVPQGNDAVAMCGLDTTGDEDTDSLLVVRNTGGDYTVYLWNLPVAGDWTFFDAIARNPSPLARDLWSIPRRNRTTVVVGINRGAGTPDELGSLERRHVGDFDFYVWNAPRPGDYTYWDAASRNPSALARDLWSIPRAHTFALSAPAM